MEPAFVIGPFDIFERIGRGGMGEVWRARHRATSTPAAIKVITAARARQPRYWTSLHREVQSTAMLVHPNIVELYDYGEIDAAQIHPDQPASAGLVPGSPFLAMELADAGSLADIMHAGHLDWPQIRAVLLSLLDALAHAHARGLIHRDIKPDNILAYGDETERRWKLTDFGIAHTLEALDSPLTAGQSDMSGTPNYMAPEQFTGARRSLSAASDLYACGCLAYQLIAGRLPFEGSTPVHLGFKHVHSQPDPLEPATPVPDGLDRWVAAMMAKKPQDRFAKAADAAWALRRLDESDAPDVDARPAPVPEQWRGVQSQPDNTLSAASARLYGLREIPVVGLEAERDRLWSALHGTRDGDQPRLAVLAGPSGCGKSRLARWLCETADESGAANVMHAAFTREGGAGEGLRQMLVRHFRSAGLAGDELRDHLAPWVERLPEAAEWLGPALVDWFADAADAGETDETDSEHSFRLVAQTLRHIAAPRPLIVWFDDVQWGEEAIAFLESVFGSGSLEGAPVLFCATAQLEALGERPELAERLDALAGRERADRVELSALADADIERLVTTLLRVDDTLVQRIARRVEGNPLFAVQLIGDWIERGWLRADAAGFVLAEGVEPELPDDLHAMWGGRIDRLLAARSDAERTALHVAALLGRQVDPLEWRRACTQAGLDEASDELTPAWRDELVAALVDQRLARRDDDGWSFIHGMLRESLARRTDEDGRAAELHAAIAAALDDLRQRRADPALTGRLGRHLYHSGALAAAIDPLLVGARRRHQQADSIAALELLDLRDRALDRLDTADGRDALEGDLLRAEISAELRRPEQVDALCDRIEARAAAAGWEDLLARALLVRCTNRHVAGRSMRGVDELGRRALEIYERLEDEAGITQARLRLGDACASRGQSEQAIEHYRHALDHGRRAGLDAAVAWSHFGLGYALQQRGALDDARRHLEASLQAYTQLDHRSELALVEVTLGDVARLQGRLDAAEASYRRALSFYESRHLAAPSIPFNLALLALERDDLADARRWAQRAAADLPRAPRLGNRLAHHAFGLLFAAHDADPAAFDEHFDAFDELVAESGLADADFAALLERAAALLGQADVARATRTLQAARDMWQTLERNDDIARVEATLAALDRRR